MIGSTPFLIVVCLFRQPWLTTRFRVRQWGRLPLRRGPTLLVTNHQHEDESEIVMERGFIQGPWRRPLFTASSRRMYEPGFFAGRMPWLAPIARTLDASRLFVSLGMLPLENQLSSRPLISLAHDVRRTHGDRTLAEVFRDEALAPLGVGVSRISDLQRPPFFERAQTMTKVALLREPFRSESVAMLRRTIDEEVAFITEVVREGTTFFVTPEGDYSTNGRMRPLRGIMTHLAPIADVWLCAIAFDPFRGRRTSMLYRVLRPADPEDIATSLAAARPVTTSALIATFVHEHHRESFTASDVLTGIVRTRAALPKRLFVDPELDAARERVVREALDNLVRRGTLIEQDGHYRLGAVRTDRRFHGVEDTIAYHATFLSETIAAAERLDAAR
jgi:hypothetical protein